MRRLVAWVVTSLVAVAFAVIGAQSATASETECDVARRQVIDVISTLDVELPRSWTTTLPCGTAYFSGFADLGQRLVTVRPEMMYGDARVMRWTALHEYGHVYAYLLDDEWGGVWRDSWGELRGISEALAWHSYDEEREPTLEEWSSMPIEEWADAFAYCYTGYEWAWRSTIADLPNADECDTLFLLVDAVVVAG